MYVITRVNQSVDNIIYIDCKRKGDNNMQMILAVLSSSCYSLQKLLNRPICIDYEYERQLPSIVCI